jgi:hypothetical protein
MKSVASLEEIRLMVGSSFDTKIFLPQDTDVWKEQLERFRKIAN